MLCTGILCSRNQFRSATADAYVLSRSMTREGTNCKDVCTEAMGCGKKGVNASQKESADQHKSESKDHSATPGKSPPFLAIKQAPERAWRRGLCQWRSPESVRA